MDEKTRDVVIARQARTIAELDEAHDAQNAVLARMQAELDTLRAECDEWKRCVVMAQDMLGLHTELWDMLRLNEPPCQKTPNPL